MEANMKIFNPKDKKINVDKDKLLVKLIKNKEKHIENYNEAISTYKNVAIQKLEEAKQKAIKLLEKNIQQRKETLNEFDPTDPNNKDYLVLVEEININLKIPKCYSDAYDSAIDFVSWEVSPTIELSIEEFECFVRDNWGWSEEFFNVSQTYKKLKF